MYKICFVTTVSITLKSFVLKFAEYLHNTGEFEVSMICSSDEDFKNNLPDYINFIPVDMKRGVGFDGLKVIKKLKKIFKEYKFDIVQYSTPNASCYASIAAKKAKIPVRLYCQWGIAYVGFNGFKRFILKKLEKNTCKCSTWIEPDSNSNLLFSHNEGLYKNNKSSVVWNGSACGVDLTKFNYAKKNLYRNEIRSKYKINDNSFVYGYVGRITRDKGINELFKAFNSNEFNDKYLMVVGPNESSQGIDLELINWSKNASNVIYVGYTTEVEKYLSSMDCFVLPSYREGFGMGIVEAEAMGVPVITTNIPGPVDAMINNKTGFLIEMKNASELRNAMLKICDLKEQYFEMSNNALTFAKENFEQKELFRRLYLDRVNLIKGAKK